MAHRKMRIQDGDIHLVKLAVRESIEVRISAMERAVPRVATDEFLSSIARLGYLYCKIGRVHNDHDAAINQVSEWNARAQRAAGIYPDVISW